MLASIRKFSSSIYAKVFLFIVAIPFVFWGMGDVFRGGNKNTIFKIENEKFSTQEFVKWVEYNAPPNGEIIDENSMQSLLSKFIGEKLVESEMNRFGIEIPEEALAYIIRNEKIFQKNNKFSRQEYEKFLLNNNLNAVTFEVFTIKVVNQYIIQTPTCEFELYTHLKIHYHKVSPFELID